MSLENDVESMGDSDTTCLPTYLDRVLVRRLEPRSVSL